MMTTLSCLVYLLLAVRTAWFAPIMDSKFISRERAVEYLQRFGYLTNGQLKGKSGQQLEVEMSKALMKLQNYAGIPQTGQLDALVKKVMLIPRCGDADIHWNEGVGSRRSKRFTLWMNGSWAKDRQLDVKYLDYLKSTNLTEEDQERIMASNVKQWADNSAVNMVFHYKNSSFTETAEFEIRHETKDGIGGIYADALFPYVFENEYTGNIYFDEAEPWAEEHMYGSISYQQVGLHELGHSLGLDHSPVQTAVMNAFYEGNRPLLTQDDINGIQKIYGAP